MSSAPFCDQSDLQRAASLARPAAPFGHPASEEAPIRAPCDPAAVEDATPRPGTPPAEGAHLRAGAHARCRTGRGASHELASSSRAASEGGCRPASPTPEGSTPRPGTPSAAIAPPFSTSRTPPPAADASSDPSNLGSAPIRADAIGEAKRTGARGVQGGFEERAVEEVRLGAEEDEEGRGALAPVAPMCCSHGLIDDETCPEVREEHDGGTCGASCDGKERGRAPESLSASDRECPPQSRLGRIPVDGEERSPVSAERRCRPPPPCLTALLPPDGPPAPPRVACAAEKGPGEGGEARSSDAASRVASTAPATWICPLAPSGLADESSDPPFEFPVRAFFSDTSVCPRVSSDSSAQLPCAARGNAALVFPGRRPLLSIASTGRLSSLADASLDRLPSLAEASLDRLPSLADASLDRLPSVASGHSDRLSTSTDAPPSSPLHLPLSDPARPGTAAISLARSFSLRRSSAPVTRVTSPTPLDPASRRCADGEAPSRSLETPAAIARTRDGHPRDTPPTSPPPARGRQPAARGSIEPDANAPSRPHSTPPPAEAGVGGARSRGSPASAAAPKPPLPPSASLSRPGSSATLGKLCMLPEGQPTSLAATPRLALGGLRRHASFCSADAETTRARILEGGGSEARGRDRPKRPREGMRDGSLPPCLRGPPLPRSATESTLMPLGAPWGGIGLGSHWRLRERLLQLQRERKAPVADDADSVEASGAGEARGARSVERRQAAGIDTAARPVDRVSLATRREPSNGPPLRSSSSAPGAAPLTPNLGAGPTAPAAAVGAAMSPSLPVVALPTPLLPLACSRGTPQSVSLPEALDEAERNALSLCGTPTTLRGPGACVPSAPLLEHEVAETERQAAFFGAGRPADRDLDAAAPPGVALSARLRPDARHADRSPRTAMAASRSPRASGPGPVAHPLPLAHPEASPTRPSRNRLGYRGSLYFLAGSAACHTPPRGGADGQAEERRFPLEVELDGSDASSASPLVGAFPMPPWQERLVSVPGVAVGRSPSSEQIACASEWLSERTPSVLPMRQALASQPAAPMPPPWGSYSGLDSGWGEGTGEGRSDGAWDAGWRSRVTQRPTCGWNSAAVGGAWASAPARVHQSGDAAFGSAAPADGPPRQAPPFLPSPSAASRHLPGRARSPTSSEAPPLRSHPIFPRLPLSHPIAPPSPDRCWTPRTASGRVDLPWRSPPTPPPPAVPSTFSPAARLDLFYRLHRSRQTVAYAGRMRDRAKRSTRGRGTCVQALRALPLVSAPCSPFPAEEHGGKEAHEGGALLRLAFAAARRCREAFPEWPWMEVVGLIHGLGKLLLLDVSEGGAERAIGAREGASDGTRVGVRAAAGAGVGTGAGAGTSAGAGACADDSTPADPSAGNVASGRVDAGGAAVGGGHTTNSSARAWRAPESSSRSALAPGPSAPGWTSAQPTWSVLGDSFPVGCRFASTLPHSGCFAANPDRRRREYASVWGVYAFECGLGRVAMSWGESEYLTCVLEKQRGPKARGGEETSPGLRSSSPGSRLLPRAALWLLRHRQFDALLDPAQPYGCLLSSQDRAMLPALRVFRGALEDAAYDVTTGRALEPAEADWERAQALLRRWGLAGEIEW